MKKTILSLLCLIPLTACGLDTDVDIQTANQIARPAFMVERTIDADTFGLNAWERMHQRGAPATIYISTLRLNWLSPCRLRRRRKYSGCSGSNTRRYLKPAHRCWRCQPKIHKQLPCHCPACDKLCLCNRLRYKTCAYPATSLHRRGR